MNKFLFITIDTEEDQWGSIGNRRPSVEAINNLKRLQRLFNAYNAVPTYLINYPVANTATSIRILEELLKTGKCEIGTHCHPWNTPPFKEEQTNVNSFLCNLPEDLVHEKMDVLHRTIKSNFGKESVTFRAGRWGIGENVLNVLAKLNYEIDSSITPFFSWTDYSGPTFNCSTNKAFYLSNGFFKESTSGKESKILELPPTMGFLQSNYILCNIIRGILLKKILRPFKIIGLLDHLGIIRYRWLSPETTNIDDMTSLAKTSFKNGNKFINMFFHSNTLIAGQTPYVTNNIDLENFYNKIENFLQYSVENNIQSIGLSKGTMLTV